MQSAFLDDYYRMTGKRSKKWLLPDLILRHNVRWAFWYRALRAGHRFARIPLYRISRKYGIEVSPSAEIGPGVYLGHPYNITVGDRVHIGKNANLHKGCTIGIVSSGKRAGSPTLGDNVFVGINAAVVGGITIGNDVLIAANAFVDFDVPAHSVVVGNPGQIHSRKHAADSCQ